MKYTFIPEGTTLKPGDSGRTAGREHVDQHDGYYLIGHKTRGGRWHDPERVNGTYTEPVRKVRRPEPVVLNKDVEVPGPDGIEPWRWWRAQQRHQEWCWQNPGELGDVESFL